jgi:hypothetical protein
MTRELIKEALSQGNGTMYILRLLESMHQVVTGFMYWVARNSEGQGCGFMWMTPVMRRMFELYRNILFLDAMKRRLILCVVGISLLLFSMGSRRS